MDYAYESYSSEVLIKYMKTRKDIFGFQIQYSSDLFQTTDMQNISNFTSKQR